MSAKKTPQRFIQDARGVHGSKFEYLLPYSSAIKKIDIFCNKCFHTFKQTPNAHLGGQGCPVCNAVDGNAYYLSKRAEAAALFVTRAQGVHGDRYDYNSTRYGKNCETRVEVRCRQHGVFLVSPSNHLKGKGCPSCAKSGFDPKKPAYLYLLTAETRTHGQVVKIGISNKPKQRLAGNRKADQIDWRMVRVRRYPDGFLPVAFEKLMIEFFGEPFKGRERFIFDHTTAIAAFDVVTSLD